MSRHSKNCTAHSVFTYNEKKKLKEYGTIQQTLGMDSFKPFHFCSLCLKPADSPTICKEGHLFCRDCIITSLVMQKKYIG
jgi:nitric oxide synthase-interacting protein